MFRLPLKQVIVPPLMKRITRKKVTSVKPKPSHVRGRPTPFQLYSGHSAKKANEIQKFDFVGFDGTTTFSLCQWMIGDHKQHRYCESKVQSGSPYCPFHSGKSRDKNAEKTDLELLYKMIIKYS